MGAKTRPSLLRPLRTSPPGPWACPMGKRTTRQASPISDEMLAVLPPMPPVGDLATLTDLRVEWGNVFRAMRRKEISHAEAGRLLYGLQVGTPIFHAEEAARQNQERERQIEALTRAVREVERLQGQTYPVIEHAESVDPNEDSAIVDNEGNTP